MTCCKFRHIRFLVSLQAASSRLQLEGLLGRFATLSQIFHFFKTMASNSSLGAALGGEGTADKIPGRSLRTLVLGRLP